MNNRKDDHPHIRRVKAVFEWTEKNFPFIELGLLGAVILLGMIGLFIAPEYAEKGLSDRLYTTFQMVTLDYGDGYINGWVNAARMLGSVFAVTIIYQIAGKVFIRLNHRIVSGNSDIFYGDNEAVRNMMQSDDRFTFQIRSNSDDFEYGQDYFLLDEEESNFNFYEAHKQKLSNKHVYLLSDTVPGTITLPEGHKKRGILTTFSFEEKAARSYWLKYPLVEALPDHTISEVCMNESMPRVRIAIAGLDSMGKELLYAGVQVNVFDVKEPVHPDYSSNFHGQIIEYHVYANEKERKDYLRHHLPDNLEKLHIIVEDKTIMEESMIVLKQYDRIIIAQQKEQLELVNDLLGILTGTRVDILTAGNIPETIYEQNRFGNKTGKKQEKKIIDNVIRKADDQDYCDDVRIFKWKNEVMNVSAVKDDDLIQDAKRINAEYVTPERDVDTEWNSMTSTFLRYSNIRSAFFRRYVSVWAARYKNLFQGMSAEERVDYFAKLEHISWWNYYLISNFTFSTVKSEYMHTHYDMQETSHLPDEYNENGLLVNEAENDRKAAEDIISRVWK